MNNINEKFAYNLSRIMDRQSKSKTDLANHLGVSKPTVSYWCSGEKLPRIDKVDKICEYLHCSRSDLLGDVGEPDTDKVLQEAFDARPEMRMLFSVAKDCTPEDIIQAIKIIEALKK